MIPKNNCFKNSEGLCAVFSRISACAAVPSFELNANHSTSDCTFISTVIECIGCGRILCCLVCSTIPHCSQVLAPFTHWCQSVIDGLECISISLLKQKLLHRNALRLMYVTRRSTDTCITYDLCHL